MYFMRSYWKCRCECIKEHPVQDESTKLINEKSPDHVSGILKKKREKKQISLGFSKKTCFFGKVQFSLVFSKKKCFFLIFQKKGKKNSFHSYFRQKQYFFQKDCRFHLYFWERNWNNDWFLEKNRTFVDNKGMIWA